MYNMTIEISIKFEIKNMSAHLDHTLSVGRQNASNFFNVRFKLSEKIQTCDTCRDGGTTKTKLIKVTGHNKIKTVT